MSNESQLKRTLGFYSVWALGVGYVISGMYFGWNLGLAEGGSIGFLIAVIAVSLLYIAFVLCYAELSCAFPHSGGVIDQARAIGSNRLATLGGLAQTIEFMFAPPAIAMAIGAYLSLFYPLVPPLVFALCAYAIFTALNIWGVKQSAQFELIVTVLAVGELLIFIAVCLPYFSWPQFTHNALPYGSWGIVKSIPYAIWFYLAIEGIANLTEETVQPEKTISRGFIASITTLTLLAFLVMFAAIGIGGWEKVVYADGSTTTSDSPLPLALAQIAPKTGALYHLLVSIGLLGLLASFHGIILASSRSLMVMGRTGFLPSILGRVHASRQTPVPALLVNFAVGVAAILIGHTAQLITIAVLGALTLYVTAFLVFFKHRRLANSPTPFKAPFGISLACFGVSMSLACLLGSLFNNWPAALSFSVLIGAGFWKKR